jgi:hypothetical protein
MRAGAGDEWHGGAESAYVDGGGGGGDRALCDAVEAVCSEDRVRVAHEFAVRSPRSALAPAGVRGSRVARSCESEEVVGAAPGVECGIDECGSWAASKVEGKARGFGFFLSAVVHRDAEEAVNGDECIEVGASRNWHDDDSVQRGGWVGGEGDGMWVPLEEGPDLGNDVEGVGGWGGARRAVGDGDEVVLGRGGSPSLPEAAAVFMPRVGKSFGRHE